MKLSIVIPAHNEEGGLAATVAELRSALAAAAIPFEIVVVDDHSTDGTARIAGELAAMNRMSRWVANAKGPAGSGTRS